MRYYAGIGSRETPAGMLETIRGKAEVLRVLGWTLNSGGAAGADSAFETGAGDECQVFLPYDGFNGRRVDGRKYIIDEQRWPDARAIAAHYHPHWDRLNEAARRFHTRNTFQVLGRDLETPVSFVLCWTFDEGQGGTSQAIRIARSRNIPVFNLRTTDFKGILDA